MASSYRRVFCPPTGLTPAQLVRWEQALASTVSMQRQLETSSPFILRLLGDLEPSAEGYVVHHEPAQPIEARVFDPAAPLSTPGELLRTASSLLDALRAYHQSRAERPPVHGGICPGVLLVTADGVPKVTDFGVAPAYALLGDDVYKNLALRTGGIVQSQEGLRLTGTWEVLKPNVAVRDDRIACFIDPEKWEGGSLQAFEPSSDVFAAGVLLHLLAEHRHPYLSENEDAHRKVDVVEFMLPINWTPQRIRRQDLCQSTDATVREWCELVAQMIDRSSEVRPTAVRAVQLLPHIDASDILQARLEAISHVMEGAAPIDWDAVRDVASGVAAHDAGNESVRQQAAAMLALCDAVERSGMENWEEADAFLQSALATPNLLPAVSAKSGELRSLLERSRAAVGELQESRGVLDSPPGSIAEQDMQLRRLAGALSGIPPESVVPFLREDLARAIVSVEDRRRQLDEELRRLEAQAQAWLEKASRAREVHDWATVHASLADKPAFLPPGLSAAVEDLQAAWQAHEEEQEARRRLRQEMERSLLEAEALLDRGQLTEAHERVGGLVRIGVDEDLSRSAAALLARIEQAAAQRQQQEAELIRLRARLDVDLQQATKHFQTEGGAGLQAASRLCQAVLASQHASGAQRETADLMLQEIRRQSDEIEQIALSEIDVLCRDEKRLQEASQLLEAGQLLDSLSLTNSLGESKFPHIRQQAAAVLDALNQCLEARRKELALILDDAERFFAQADFQQALRLAEQVWEDRASDEHLLDRAHQRIGAAQAELERLAKERADAERELTEGLACLARAEIAAARVSFDRARKSGQLLAQEQAQLDLVLVSMPSLETASKMLTAEDYPAALETSLQIQADSTCELAREAAARLAETSRTALSASLLKGITKHLEHRAQVEERKRDVEEVSPDESLGGASPAWLRSYVGQFDSFVQDCTIADRPPREPPLKTGSRLGNKYEIQEFLGRGGMGEVYRALDLKLKREVALKVAPPRETNAGLAEALQNEAEAIASLSHPNVVHINSFDVIDDRPCFDTNYMSGRDLAAYTGGRPLAASQAAQILIPICDALGYAHGRGVLHRDIKPQNIYVGDRPGEGPWLIDFGLARIRSICNRREFDGLCGTPGYLAPEVIRSLGRSVDARADVFAMGCVLYVLLTGQVPFRPGGGASAAANVTSRTLLQTIHDQVDPLSRLSPGTPEELRRICQKAMAADPADRFESAEALREALSRFLQESEAQEARRELTAAREKFESRRRGSPAELEDLDAAAELAHHLKQRPIEPLQKEADQLLRQIKEERQGIIASQTDARQQLEGAAASLAERKYRAARSAAFAVTENGYVPDLHAQARDIAGACAQHLRTIRRKRLGIVSVALLIVITAGAGVWTFLKPKPPHWELAINGPDSPVTEGQEVVLTTSLEGPTLPGTSEYQWYKDGQLLPGQTTREFRTSSAQLKDKGEYACEVLVDNKPLARRSRSLTVVERPPPYTFKLDGPASALAVGGAFTLKVQWGGAVPSAGRVTYVWSRDGTALPETSDVVSRSPAKTTDSGKYTCLARVEGKPLPAAEIQVTINPPPQYTVELSPPGKLELPAKGSVNIRAVVAPAPLSPPEFKWYVLDEKGAEKLLPGQQAAELSVSEPGTYFCRVTVQGSETSTSDRRTLTRKPLLAVVTAFVCDPPAGSIQATSEIECIVEFDKPRSLTAAEIEIVNGTLSALDASSAPAQAHRFKVKPAPAAAAVSVGLARTVDSGSYVVPTFSYTAAQQPSPAPKLDETAIRRQIVAGLTASPFKDLLPPFSEKDVVVGSVADEKISLSLEGGLEAWRIEPLSVGLSRTTDAPPALLLDKESLGSALKAIEVRILAVQKEAWKQREGLVLPPEITKWLPEQWTPGEPTLPAKRVTMRVGELAEAAYQWDAEIRRFKVDLDSLKQQVLKSLQGREQDLAKRVQEVVNRANANATPPKVSLTLPKSGEKELLFEASVNSDKIAARFQWDPRKASYEPLDAANSLASFEARIKKAMEVPVPPAPKTPVVLNTDSMEKDLAALKLSFDLPVSGLTPALITLDGAQVSSLDPADGVGKEFKIASSARVCPGSTVAVEIKAFKMGNVEVKGKKWSVKYFPSWLESRARWEEALKRPQGQDSWVVGAAEAPTFLSSVLEAKSGERATIGTPEDRAKALSDALNKGVEAKWQTPVGLCIEYVWGAQSLYAVRWQAGTGGKTVTCTRVAAVKDVWAVILRARQDPAASELGDLIFRRTLSPLTATNNMLGIVLAPDGPLCMVPLLDLPFTLGPQTLKLYHDSVRIRSSTRAPEDLPQAKEPASLHDRLCPDEQSKMWATAVWVTPTWLPSSSGSVQSRWQPFGSMFDAAGKLTAENFDTAPDAGALAVVLALAPGANTQRVADANNSLRKPAQAPQQMTVGFAALHASREELKQAATQTLVVTEPVP